VTDDPARRPRRLEAEPPAHPRMKAALLMIAVVVAIVVFASISTFGPH
jgi:hypothetical protein